MGLGGTRTVYVTFAWSDAPAVPVNVGLEQTLREAVTPFLPSSVRNDQIGIIDLAGTEVTDRRGAQMEQNSRVIVNTTGFVPGGWQSPRDCSYADLVKLA